MYKAAALVLLLAGVVEARCMSSCPDYDGPCIQVCAPDGGVGRLVRLRADSIDTVPVYCPSQIDLQFNKTRSDIRLWLKNANL